MDEDLIRHDLKFDEDTDIRPMFDRLWEHMATTDEDTIRQAFLGIDVGRKSLLKALFETEGNFCTAPKILQRQVSNGNGPCIIDSN